MNLKNEKFSGKIISDAVTNNGMTRFYISNVHINNVKIFGKFYVSDKSGRPIERGDYVLIRGKTKTGENNITGMINGEVVLAYESSTSNYFLRIRNVLSDRVRKNLPDSVAGLGLAYLLGEKFLLDKDLTKAFNRSGLSHIIVASGFALSTLVNMTAGLFRNHSRFATLAFSLLTMMLFVSFTGFTASMTRAFVMAGLSTIVGYFGRKLHPTRIILLVASLSLILDPSNFWSVAWQLSFLAFFGITILAPLLKVYFYGTEKINFVADLLISSSSAQLCCLPVLIYNFGSFTLAGIVSNLILPPLLGITMLSVLAVAIFASTILGELISGWTCGLLNFHIGIVDFFSMQRWLTIKIEPGNAICFSVFLLIGAFVIFLAIRNRNCLIAKEAM